MSQRTGLNSTRAFELTGRIARYVVAVHAGFANVNALTEIPYIKVFVSFGDANPLLIRVINVLRTRRKAARYGHQNNKESHGVTFVRTSPIPRVTVWFRSKEQIPTFVALPLMADDNNPFLELGFERAIALRWTLRDIKAKRLKMSPISEPDQSTLIDLGLIEMRDEVPVLTNAGHTVLD